MSHCQSLIDHLNAIPITYYSKENALEYQKQLNFQSGMP
jgi:hypothetical protein